MKNNINQNTEIERLLDLYYRGETTIEQERQLKSMLAAAPERSLTPEGMAAKATKAYFDVARSRKRVNWRVWIAAAASIAVICALGVTFLRSPATTDDFTPAEGECIAYVNGVQVNSTDEVMDLMADQLRIVGDGALDFDTSIDEEMDTFNEIFQ